MFSPKSKAPPNPFKQTENKGMFGGLLSRKTEKYKKRDDMELKPRDRAFSETDNNDVNNEIKIVGGALGPRPTTTTN